MTLKVQYQVQVCKKKVQARNLNLNLFLRSFSSLLSTQAYKLQAVISMVVYVSPGVFLGCCRRTFEWFPIHAVATLFDVSVLSYFFSFFSTHFSKKRWVLFYYQGQKLGSRVNLNFLNVSKYPEYEKSRFPIFIYMYVQILWLELVSQFLTIWAEIWI